MTDASLIGDIGVVLERLLPMLEQQSHPDWMAKIRSLKEENARLQENGKEMLKENTALKRENVYLRRMLRTYLYPGIANQILKESGLPVEGENAVKPEKFGELIEGKKPDAFRGRQKTPAPVLSWQERLQKELERQVSQDGNP